jgi:hypothetical protein
MSPTSPTSNNTFGSNPVFVLPPLDPNQGPITPSSIVHMQRRVPHPVENGAPHSGTPFKLNSAPPLPSMLGMVPNDKNKLNQAPPLPSFLISQTMSQTPATPSSVQMPTSSNYLSAPGALISPPQQHHHESSNSSLMTDDSYFRSNEDSTDFEHPSSQSDKRGHKTILLPSQLKVPHLQHLPAPGASIQSNEYLRMLSPRPRKRSALYCCVLYCCAVLCLFFLHYSPTIFLLCLHPFQLTNVVFFIIISHLHVLRTFFALYLSVLKQCWVLEPVGMFGAWAKQWLVILPGQLFTFRHSNPHKDHWHPTTAILFIAPPEVRYHPLLCIPILYGLRVESNMSIFLCCCFHEYFAHFNPLLHMFVPYFSLRREWMEQICMCHVRVNRQL